MDMLLSLQNAKNEIAALEVHVQQLRKGNEDAKKALGLQQVAIQKVQSDLEDKKKAAEQSTAELERLHAEQAETQAKLKEREQKAQQELLDIANEGQRLLARNMVTKQNLGSEELAKLKEKSILRTNKVIHDKYDESLKKETPQLRLTDEENLPEIFKDRIDKFRETTTPLTELCPTLEYIQRLYPDVTLPENITSVKHSFSSWLGTVHVRRGKPDIIVREQPINRRADLITQLLPSTERSNVAKLLVLVATEDDVVHPFHRISVLVADVTDNGKHTTVAYGGDWEERDGMVDDSKDLRNTARRALREVTGVDVHSSLKPKEVMDVKYGERCSSYFVTDFSNELPRVFEMNEAIKASAGLHAKPKLVSIYTLLKGGEEYDPELVLAAHCIKNMLVLKNGKKLRSCLLSMQKKRFERFERKRKMSASEGGSSAQLTVSESLECLASIPLAFLDCPATPQASPSGLASFNSVASSLIFANPTIDDRELYNLMCILGLDQDEESCFLTALTLRTVIKGESSDLDSSAKKGRYSV